MSTMASQITSLTIVSSNVYSGAYQRKHQHDQSSSSLGFVCGIHRWPVNSPHKGPITRKIFPFDNVIMIYLTSDHVEWLIQSSQTNVIYSGVVSTVWFHHIYMAYVYMPGVYLISLGWYIHAMVTDAIMARNPTNDSSRKLLVNYGQHHAYQ